MPVDCLAPPDLFIPVFSPISRAVLLLLKTLTPSSQPQFIITNLWLVPLHILRYSFSNMHANCSIFHSVCPKTCKVKLKLSLCLAKHRAMKTYWRSGSIAPSILDIGTRRWMVSFTPQPLYPQEKSTWYPLDRRLGGPQSRSGHGGEEKNSPAPAGNRTLELRSSSPQPSAIPTELSRLFPKTSGLYICQKTRCHIDSWYSLACFLPPQTRLVGTLLN
jgi:hypothetical protein